MRQKNCFCKRVFHRSPSEDLGFSKRKTGKESILLSVSGMKVEYWSQRGSWRAHKWKVLEEKVNWELD